MSWIPTGPTSVQDVSTMANPVSVPVSGRVKDMAVSPDGMRIYVATSTGGVWRSDDGGMSWTAKTDGQDFGPTTMHACSLACGAIAIDPNNVDRVWVGTGEPNWFGGVGVIYSQDGGGTWSVEAVAAGSPSLMGTTCYAMLLDPNNADRLVGVFSTGVYRREPDGLAGFHWVVTLVAQPFQSFFYTDGAVASSAGTTTFYVAQSIATPDPTHLPGVLQSADGATWSTVGTGFPTGSPGSFVLAVQPTNPNVIYALSPLPGLAALYRIDLPDPQWRPVGGLPGGLFSGQPPRACAVDPNDASYLYIASVLTYQCHVTSTGSGMSLIYTVATTYAGTHTHNDVYRIRYMDSDRIWLGGDGGLFYAPDARTGPTWQSMNVGLATLQANALDVHPTQDAVMFIATQDNGTIRSIGDEVWQNTVNMDGAAVLINWADPYSVLTCIGGNDVWRATDGVHDVSSWSNVSLPNIAGGIFVPRLANTPYNPGSPMDAQTVAWAGGNRLWMTQNFGTSWVSIPNGDATDNLPNNDTFVAAVFASPTRIFAGSSAGVVRRFDLDPNGWSVVDLAALSDIIAVSGLALDYADASRQSIYLAAYNAYDFRRVWHYDGMTWTAVSGPAAGDPSAIRDAAYNAIATDPLNPSYVYAGCDVGVWLSTDGGTSWAPYNDGLPQCPVTGLHVHRTFRTLYASLYGRGVFERDLTGAAPPNVDLYIRKTLWDTAKRPVVDGLDSPIDKTTKLYHWDGPDIAVDSPDSLGHYQFPSATISQYDFIHSLIDESGLTETIDPAQPPIVNRVYVRVHNRGVASCGDARLTLFLAPCSPGLPLLPMGYAANAQNGTAFGGSQWAFVGTQLLDAIRIGYPVVAEFDLPSTMLPPPAMLPGASHYCLLAFVHSPSLDPFTATQQNVDALVATEHKAANKNLTIVAYPAPGHPKGMHRGPGRGGTEWIPVRLNGSNLGDLVLDAPQFRGSIELVVPLPLVPHLALRSARPVVHHPFADVLKQQLADLRTMLKFARFNPTWTQDAIGSLEAANQGELITGVLNGAPLAILQQPRFDPEAQHTIYLSFVPEEPARLERQRVHLVQRSGRHHGGITYELRPERHLRRKR